MSNKNKNATTLGLIGTALMLVTLIGSTFAFIRYSNEKRSADLSSTTEGLYLEYTDCATGVDDCKEINASLAPGESITKTFKVQNKAKSNPAAYSIVFKELQNSFSNDELVYKLEDITSTAKTLVDTTPVPYNLTKTTNVNILSYDSLGVNETKQYRLTITFVDSNNQQSSADATFDIKIGLKEEIYLAPVVTTRNIYCVDESNNEMTCPQTLAIGQRIAIGRDTPQYFRYIRTTNTSDTTHTYNECQDGGAASIACTDADSRHPLANNQLRLLAEYNLYVGAIYNNDGSSKISDVDTTSATYGLQDSRALGYVENQNRVGTVAYGASNNNYSESNVKIYTESYANYLNTTYFGGSSEVSGSAITLEELKMLGCNQSSYTCSGAPSWVYTTTYWSFSPYDTSYVWSIASDAHLITGYYVFDFSDDFYCGVRPVISVSASYFE